MTDNIDITVANESADSIKIADDVIKCIAALAAADIDGVAGMAGSSTNELLAKLGGKTLEKGVKMAMDEDGVKLTLSLTIKYGYGIPEVCKRVQDKVRSTIENMTGFTVNAVDVNIAGIDTSSEEI